MQITREQLLTEIEEFLTKHEMSASRFGHLARKDQSFVFDMRAGERKFYQDTLVAVQTWMQNYKQKKKRK